MVANQPGKATHSDAERFYRNSLLHDDKKLTLALVARLFFISLPITRYDWKSRRNCFGRPRFSVVKTTHPFPPLCVLQLPVLKR